MTTSTKRLRVELEAEFSLHDNEVTHPDGTTVMEEGGDCYATGIAFLEVPADYTGPKSITKTFKQPFSEVISTQTMDPELIDVILARLKWTTCRFREELRQEPVEVVSISPCLAPSDDEMSCWEMRVVSVEEVARHQQVQG